ncbi:hypothetical protein [Sphingomonas sp. BAUL-RG-20F-R05-02]|uniref:hypothetical protein n=1 Tax=Sphingomonas sp. BAUL-RG-20F-R05-02 TaxID=2914830 RepID=UPI001F59F335|nr:hypothetical protein [Sphingomonas sp. BAUL-RG-20F-R05-02]
MAWGNAVEPFGTTLAPLRRQRSRRKDRAGRRGWKQSGDKLFRAEPTGEMILNLKGLSPSVSALVESVRDAAIEEGFDITDIDEDGDTVALTFTRETDVSGDHENDEDEEE